MWYYYIIVFFIIMTLYSFYRQDIDYMYNSLSRRKNRNIFSNLRSYYGYHMI